MSSPKQSSKPPVNQRLPAPQLFVGPPSRNASSTSLLPPPGAAPQAARAPLNRQRSYLRNETRADVQASHSETHSTGSPSGRETTLQPTTPFGRRQPTTQAPGTSTLPKSQDKTDATWTEMQNTLKEVELNAASGSHVFSSRHARALDELRAAQIALAQAWARSEADESATRGEEVETIKSNYDNREAHDSAEAISIERRAGIGAEGKKQQQQRRGSTTSVKSVSSVMEKSQLEQETEYDISLARKRREANDRYFQRVNAGVVDVVAKLEEVAKQMKGVEFESREIWGGDEGSVGTASVTG